MFVAHRSSYADEARHQAQQILLHPPFTTSDHTPRPFAGVLHAIGHGLDVAFGPIWHWTVLHLFHPVGSGFSSAFGGWAPVVGIVLAVGLGVVLGWLLIRRRTRISSHANPATEGRTLPIDPGALDEQARRAEADGDHERAVRLRFRAGLLRLERKKLIGNRDVTTNTQLSNSLHSPSFDSLARRHESIVYGGDPATSQDAATARERWPSVLDEARVADRVGGP
jgi:hypothetical protein